MSKQELSTTYGSSVTVGHSLAHNNLASWPGELDVWLDGRIIFVAVAHHAAAATVSICYQPTKRSIRRWINQCSLVNAWPPPHFFWTATVSTTTLLFWLQPVCPSRPRSSRISLFLVALDTICFDWDCNLSTDWMAFAFLLSLYLSCWLQLKLARCIKFCTDFDQSKTAFVILQETVFSKQTDAVQQPTVIFLSCVCVCVCVCAAKM